MLKVIHEYMPKDLRRLKRKEEADCTTCAFARKAQDLGGGEIYICQAALYDTKTLACYVSREEVER